MAGAAAVIGAVRAIAALKLPIKVTGWVPTAENMPSGTAQRPGDVITMYGGTTVEVLNTDAEGRLILADALGMAAEENPDLIIDVATLTGAATVALGLRTTGVMSNRDDARTPVVDAAGRAGEEAWPRDSHGSISTSPAQRSTPRAPTDTHPRAAPDQPCARSSRWPSIWPNHSPG